MVKKEKTGASGRSQMRMVRPFGSFLTVMRFSKDATSWAAARAVRTRMEKAASSARCFIEPPGQLAMTWTNMQGRSLKLRGGKGGCQTGQRLNKTKGRTELHFA